MPCEFMNTPVCPMTEAIPTLRTGLGEAASGFTPKELREIECKDDSDAARKVDCSTFRIRKGL